MKVVGPDDVPVEGNEPTRVAQVLRFGGVSRLDLQADLVLSGALEKGLKTAIVIGYTDDGAEYFASSMSDGADVIWLMERFKQMLLRLGERDGNQS